MVSAREHKLGPRKISKPQEDYMVIVLMDLEKGEHIQLWSELKRNLLKNDELVDMS